MPVRQLRPSVLPQHHDPDLQRYAAAAANAAVERMLTALKCREGKKGSAGLIMRMCGVSFTAYINYSPSILHVSATLILWAPLIK